METVGHSIQEFASALVQAEQLKLKAIEVETAAENRKAEIEAEAAAVRAKAEAEVAVERAKTDATLALYDSQQNARREMTIRWATPPAIIGIIGFLFYVAKLGVLTQAATALVTLGVLVDYLKRLAEHDKKDKEQDKASKKP